MLPSSSLVAIFAFSFAVAIGAVMSPGPISTTIVSQAPQRGWTVGPLVAAGHALLELAMVFMITIGLGNVLASHGVQTGIALAGSLLLAWMGGSMLWGIWRGRIHLPKKDEQRADLSASQLVGMGLAATASNPFWYAWWVTVADGYLAQAQAVRGFDLCLRRVLFVPGLGLLQPGDRRLEMTRQPR